MYTKGDAIARQRPGMKVVILLVYVQIPVQVTTNVWRSEYFFYDM